jgi:fumarylacetoacetate (FAA) hydrolase
MKVATFKAEGRDGRLAVVDQRLTRAAYVPEIADTLQRALENWRECAPLLDQAYARINADELPNAFPFDQERVHSPLPRAYQWCEASVWIVHLERCRKSTNRELPQSLYHEIGMYQGGSDSFVAPRAPMLCFDDDWDADVEAGICVITDDVPMGVDAEAAAGHIKLVLLVNDFSLRKLQIPEMAKGLGVLVSKPANAYSPVAVSPETLGLAWRENMLARPVEVHVRGERIGCPRGDVDALFRFPELIAHLARTRNIAAGSIIGAGTVANRDPAAGSACLMEKRAVEILEHGAATTRFLKFGDAIRIECFDDRGQSIFGAIEQVLTPADQKKGR